MARRLKNVRRIAASDLGEGLSLEDICPGDPTASTDLSTELRQRAAALYVEPLRRAKATYLTADLLVEAADEIDALRASGSVQLTSGARDDRPIAGENERTT